MADVKIRIIGEDEASDELDKIDGNMGGLGSAFEELTGSSLTTTAAFTALAGATQFAIQQAIEQERVMAQTANVIEATGGAAGLTAQQIADLAQAESQLTGLDDELIQGGENMLLTFKNIGGETFPAATRAMEDMAVAMAGGNLAAVDLQGTAIQLGKALNDPIAGLTALSRAGVTFSDEQKDLIRTLQESGDLMGAQAVILDELESEFGGAAKAAGDTLEGSLAKLNNTIGNLGAEIGGELIPILNDAAQAMLTILTASDKIRTATENHAKSVLSASGSYEEYVAEMTRVLEAQGFVVEVTEEGINVLERQGAGLFVATNQYRIYSQATYEAARASEEEALRLEAMQNSLENSQPSVSTSADLQRDFADTLYETSDGAQAAIDAYNAMVEAADTLAITQSGLAAGLSGELLDATTTYSESMDDLVADHQALAEEMQKLLDNGYSATSSQVQELTGALEENEVAQQAALEKMQLATAEMIYQQAAAGLDAAAALELANSMGLISEADYVVASSLEALRQQWDANRDGAITAAEGAEQFASQVALVNQAVANLQARGATVTFESLAKEMQNLATATEQADVAGTGEEFSSAQEAVEKYGEATGTAAENTDDVVSAADDAAGSVGGLGDKAGLAVKPVGDLAGEAERLADALGGMDTGINIRVSASGLQEAIDLVNNLKSTIDALPTSVTSTITVTVAEGSTAPPGADSINTANTAQGTGGVSASQVQINNYISDPLAAAMVLAQQDDLARQRAEAAM